LGEAIDIVDCLHEDDRVGRLSHRALDLLVAVVADQDDRVPVFGKFDCLPVDLGHQRAGGVDGLEAAAFGVGMNRRRDPVGREDGRGALRDRVVELVDEDRPAPPELLDDVLVVDDLLADVDRGAVELERAFDRLHGAIDSGAIATRGGKEDLLRRVHGLPVYVAQRRLSSSTSSTTASPATSSDRGETFDMSSARVSRHGYSKSIRSIAGIPLSRNGVWSS
jgi:hypothetical protein